VQEFQSIIVPYQKAACRCRQARGRQPTGAVGRDKRIHHVETGRVIGDKDQVNPGIERRGDAGLLP
jgi:hypothetical protein